MKNNEKIRSELKAHNMKHYELADLLGISENTLCRKMRKELPKEEQEKIIAVIRGNATVTA